MNSFLVVGYSKSGTYTVVVDARSKEKAMKKGKGIINNEYRPTCKVNNWHIQDYT